VDQPRANKIYRILILSLRLLYAPARNVKEMKTSGVFQIDPGRLDMGGADGELEVVVPYTGPETTAVALERAAVLTAGLNARVLLIAVHTLPYPVPFVCPTMVHAYLVEQLLELAGHSTLAVQPQVVLARDRLEGFRYALKPGSTVLVAAHKHIWQTQEEKLARALAADGHKVALMHIV
jgi:hypothetical protein